MRLWRQERWSRWGWGTNHVIKCPKCQADVWTYNLPNHYQNMHADTELSVDLKIGDVEHKYLSS